MKEMKTRRDLHLEMKHSIIIDEMENKESATDIQEYNEREIVADRRREQFEMRLSGKKRADIIEDLSARYGVAIATIDQDWQRREDWVLDVVGVTDVQGLVASKVGSLNLSQSFRKKLLDSLLSLMEKLSPPIGSDAPLTIEELEAVESLPLVWNMVMKLLNDLDSSEKTKADILLKLGILKEAPKKYILDKKEVKIEHKIDWNKITEDLDERSRRKLFNELDMIEIDGAFLENQEEYDG